MDQTGIRRIGKDVEQADRNVCLWHVVKKMDFDAVLFDMDGVKLTFEHDALLEIAKKSIERKTGARGLRAIMESVMMDDMYHIPSDDSVREVVITKDKVDRNLILRDHGENVLSIEDSETSKKDKKSA